MALNFLHDLCFLILVTAKSFSSWLNNYADIQTKKRAIILCNGPSLSSDIQTIFNRSEGADLYCVNSFGLTNYFEKLKPNFYVFADPMYWLDNINDDIRQNRESIFLALLKAKWPITIICPKAGVSFLNKSLGASDYIRIVGIKRNECQFKYFSFHIFALKYGLATPNFINVSILALWWCIIKRVQEIELFGADFSFHLGLRLNQDNGEPMTETYHFYEDQKEEGMKELSQKYIGRRKKKMHERFFQVWTAFHQIYLLSELCKIKKFNLINFSSNTNIDTIKRQKKI